MNEQRLHIGCGTKIIDGFVNMDVDDAIPDVDVHGSIQDLARFADGQFREIYLSHTLEHIPYGEVSAVLRELNRICAPAGVVRISVPDLDRICRLYVEHLDWFAPPHSPWLGLIYGGQANEYDFHKGGFNFRYLEGLLVEAGFTSVTEVSPTEEYGIRDASFANRPFGPVSLNVTAVRSPAGTTVPRFRHTWFERALIVAERCLDGGLQTVVRARLALIRRRRRANRLD